MITIPLTVNGQEVSATVTLMWVILDAICDAVGIRIHRLPARPELIREALERPTVPQVAAAQMEAGSQRL